MYLREQLLLCMYIHTYIQCVHLLFKNHIYVIHTLNFTFQIQYYDRLFLLRLFVEDFALNQEKNICMNVCIPIRFIQRAPVILKLLRKRHSNSNIY